MDTRGPTARGARLGKERKYVGAEPKNGGIVCMRPREVKKQESKTEEEMTMATDRTCETGRP